MATIVVVVLVIVSFVFLTHSVANQEQSLLQSDTSQLALTLDEAITAVGAPLSTLGEVMAATQDSPSLFQSQAKVLTARPGTSIAVADSVAGRFTVDLAAGPDFVVGQDLPPALATAVASAGPKFSATKVLHIGDKTFLGFLVSTVSGPQGTVVIELEEIHPSVPIASATNPYGDLNLGVYASATADPAQLVLGSLGSRPLPSPVAHAFITVGSSKWLVVASAKTPLVGRTSRLVPWIVLAAGLVIALLVGASSEILARRRRYAEGVAAERTEELIAAQASLVRKERLSAVGEMATVIGHELRNPLGAAINLLFLARNRSTVHDDPELDGYLDRAERETNRAAALSEDLTAYMRERPPDIVALDLGALVAEVLESTPPPPGIEVSAGDLGIEVQADRAQLVQMVTNLITNGYQAMPDGGLLRVTGTESDGFVEIAVEDSGVGIDPAVAERLLEPFFTTKATGTGLGLAIVKRFAEGHDGTVSIENGPGGGARVTIRLPHVTAQAAP
jgi:signal transduction histidine kinase/type II secretory pathway pseudopilin PulG